MYVQSAMQNFVCNTHSIITQFCTKYLVHVCTVHTSVFVACTTVSLQAVLETKLVGLNIDILLVQEVSTQFM